MADTVKGAGDRKALEALDTDAAAVPLMVEAEQGAEVDDFKATTRTAPPVHMGGERTGTESHPMLATVAAPEEAEPGPPRPPLDSDKTVPSPHANDILDLMSSAPEDTLEGQVVAVRYKVIRKIGEGGMGAVYLAEHVTIEKKVALKVLLHEFARKPVIKERFLQEAKAAAKIGHENIVDIIDFGHTPNGTLFFAMEYMDGKDLADVVQMDGPMEWQRLKPIMLQICRGMHAAHDAGIIHRDMKPENIFLMDRGAQKDFVKILDFGIAKVSLGDEGGAKLTRTGMVFGTPQYMSPEQAQGKTPDNRVDIYSVGCIMYELLTGQVPFPGDSFMAILAKHISEEPRPMLDIRPEGAWPEPVAQIVAKAMAKNPEHRFQSMADMAKALSRISEDHPPGPETEKHLAIPVAGPKPDDPLLATLDVDPKEMEARLRQRGKGKARSIAMMLGGLIGVVALALIIIFSARRIKEPATPAASGEPTATVKAPVVEPEPKPTVEAKPDAGPPEPDQAITPDQAAPKPKAKPRKRPRRKPKPKVDPKPEPKPEPAAKPKPKPKQKVRDLLDPFG